MTLPVDTSEAAVERCITTLSLCAKAHWVQGNEATTDELNRSVTMFRALRAALTEATEKRDIYFTALDAEQRHTEMLRSSLTARDAALLQAQRDLQNCHAAFLNNIKSPAAHDRYAGIAERGIEAICAALSKETPK